MSPPQPCPRRRPRRLLAADSPRRAANGEPQSLPSARWLAGAGVCLALLASPRLGRAGKCPRPRERSRLPRAALPPRHPPCPAGAAAAGCGRAGALPPPPPLPLPRALPLHGPGRCYERGTERRQAGGGPCVCLQQARRRRRPGERGGDGRGGGERQAQSAPFPAALQRGGAHGRPAAAGGPGPRGGGAAGRGHVGAAGAQPPPGLLGGGGGAGFPAAHQQPFCCRGTRAAARRGAGQRGEPREAGADGLDAEPALLPDAASAAEPPGLHPAQAQDQQEAADALHHGAAAGAGAQVPAEAVPVHRRARRVLQLAQPHRDAGEDLVPEPARQGQETAGGRAGEAEDGSQAHAAARRLRPLLPPGRPGRGGRLALRRLQPLPARGAARVARGTVHGARGLQHVPPHLGPRPGPGSRPRGSLRPGPALLPRSRRAPARGRAAPGGRAPPAALPRPGPAPVPCTILYM